MCEHCASTDGARRAQNCALYTSVCFVVSVPLFAMCSRLFMLCVKMYAVCRSQMFVNMRCRIHSLYSSSTALSASTQRIAARMTRCCASAPRRRGRAAGRLSFPCIQFKALQAPLTSRDILRRCPPVKPPKDHTGKFRSGGGEKIPRSSAARCTFFCGGRAGGRPPPLETSLRRARPVASPALLRFVIIFVTVTFFRSHFGSRVKHVSLVSCGPRHVCVDSFSVSFSCLLVLVSRCLTHAVRRGIGDSGRGDS